MCPIKLNMSAAFEYSVKHNSLITERNRDNTIRFVSNRLIFPIFRQAIIIVITNKTISTHSMNIFSGVSPLPTIKNIGNAD